MMLKDLRRAFFPLHCTEILVLVVVQIGCHIRGEQQLLTGNIIGVRAALCTVVEISC